MADQKDLHLVFSNIIDNTKVLIVDVFRLRRRHQLINFLAPATSFLSATFDGLAPEGGSWFWNTSLATNNNSANVLSLLN